MKSCPLCGSRVLYAGTFALECTGELCTNRDRNYTDSFENRVRDFAHRFGFGVVRDGRGFLALDLPDDAAKKTIDACLEFMRCQPQDEILADAAAHRMAA